MSRTVTAPVGFEEEVLADFRNASVECVAGVDFLLEELAAQDPDPDERCGLLALRFELYALRIPGCPRWRLLLSIERPAEPALQPCRIHGLAPALARPCDLLRPRAERHLRLINPVWEPAR